DEFSCAPRQHEGPRHLPRDVPHPQAVFDARMIRPRKHEIREAELTNRIESLELERFEEVEGQRIEANRPMDRVGNRLQIRHPTRQPLPAYVDSARPFDKVSSECRRV